MILRRMFLDTSDILLLISLVILLILSSFFSCAETALTTCNLFRMRTRAEEGDRKAKKVIKITDKKAKMLSAILIGNNIVNISASSIATVLAIRFFGDMGAGIATGGLTLLVLIFGEISPKTLATIKADSISRIVAPVIDFWMMVLTPVIIAVNFLANCFLRLIRIDPNARNASITEAELLTMVDVSQEEGVIEQEEKEMINNVVDFGDATASDIMIPHEDMTMIEVNASYADIMRVFQQDFFTRLPVYEGNRDNIVGILIMKDLLLVNDKSRFNVRKYIRKPLFTFESKKLSELLHDMKESYMNLAIVMNEYGGVSGMITMEDLLEEIVGEIRDEYDREEAEFIKKIADDEYLIQAKMNLDDINDQLGTELASENYESLGGLMIELLDRFPVVGDEADFENVHLKVEAMKRQRVDTVRVKITEVKEENEEDEE